MTLLARRRRLIAGILSDRIGRVLTCNRTVLWFAFTFLCGLAQNYDTVAGRTDPDGFGFGGEWTAGAVLIGEVIKARDRGKAVGLVQSGWAIGWGLTAILYSLMFSLLPPEEAWRAVHARPVAGTVRPGGASAGQGTGDLPRGQAAQPGRRQGQLLRDLRPRDAQHHPARPLLTTGALGGYYAITAWLPTFLKTERGLTVLGTSGYLAMVILGSYVGYVVVPSSPT